VMMEFRWLSQWSSSSGGRGESRGSLLVHPSECHGALKALRSLEFDIDTNGVGKASSEQSNLLL
jgi:hypothetical protein